MSVMKVNHSVIQPFAATSIAASTTDSTTCEWLDVNGWIEKVVTLECTSSGSIDVDVDMLVSPKGAYELNNETTVDTEDYQLVNIVTTHTAATLTRFDGEAIDDLTRPIRSAKFTIDNDNASNAVTVNLWFEGQS